MWNTAKKRFQRDLDKYPKALRDALYKQKSKYNLPTFPLGEYVPKDEIISGMEKVKIASGDFVYVTEGEHKGKISNVIDYMPQSDSFILSDVTGKRLIPKNLWTENQTTHLMDYPEPVPRRMVKLAAKDRDEKGKVSFVVADDVVLKSKYYDPRYRRWIPRRFVKHHELIEVPWPKPPLEPTDDYLSTTADSVFLKTYETQSIARSPVPKTVMAELRNPYSNHKKKALTEFQARRLNAPQMPLSTEQKIYLAKKAVTPEKKLQPLTHEIKDFIGERMAAHINKISNPALLTHLEALSKSTIPDFKKTMEKLEKQEKAQ